MKRYDEKICEKFLQFTECPKTLEIFEFKKWIENLNTWSREEFMFLNYYLIDDN